MRHVLELHFHTCFTIYLFVQSALPINLDFGTEAWAPETMPEVGIRFLFVHQFPLQ